MIRRPPRSTLSLHDALPIFGGRPTVEGDLPYVDADNRGGAVQAVRHLARSGRRRIATITGPPDMPAGIDRSEEHTSELQSRQYLVCRLLLEKKKTRY